MVRDYERSGLSLPARERGLKLLTVSVSDWTQIGVAPRAGAWIETDVRSRAAAPRGVAPRAGAWIETCWL